MAESHKKPQGPSPSIRKIMQYLLCLLLPILAAGSGFIFFSVNSSQEHARRRVAAAVESQLGELDATLSSINFYITESLMKNAFVQRILTSQDVHERNMAARELQEEIDRQSNFWTGGFSFMLCAPGQNMTVTRYDSGASYLDCLDIRRQLEQRAFDGAVQNSLLWHPIEVNGQPYLYQQYALNGCAIAYWISCGNAFSLIENSILSPEGMCVVLDRESRPFPGSQGLEQWTGPDGRIQPDRQGVAGIFRMRRADIQLLVVDEAFTVQDSEIVLLSFFIVTLLIVMGFSLYALFYFHRYIEEPFRQFQEHINDYANQQKAIRRRGFAELYEAVEAFDSLKKQLEELKIDVYEERLALARTELEYFQLQIKPHFFVNCFSILFGMAQKKDYARIQKFCLKLSSYIRYLFRDGLRTVPLQDELAMIREYLDIQDIRHRTESALEEFIEPELSQAQIPPLLLLTFVENSVKHASSSTAHLFVKITVSRCQAQEEPALCLCVLDNGDGIPEENLEEMNALANTLDFTGPYNGRHIGTLNVYKRLSLLYGSRYSLHIGNQDGHACVKIRIPWTNPPAE